MQKNCFYKAAYSVRIADFSSLVLICIRTLSTVNSRLPFSFFKLTALTALNNFTHRYLWHVVSGSSLRSTLFIHGVCMLRECIYGECAHEQHVRRTLTLTHTITAYSVSGDVVRVRILTCATRQNPRRKTVYPSLSYCLYLSYVFIEVSFTSRPTDSLRVAVHVSTCALLCLMSVNWCYFCCVKLAGSRRWT